MKNDNNKSSNNCGLFARVAIHRMLSSRRKDVNLITNYQTTSDISKAFKSSVISPYVKHIIYKGSIYTMARDDMYPGDKSYRYIEYGCPSSDAALQVRLPRTKRVTSFLSKVVTSEIDNCIRVDGITYLDDVINLLEVL
jgi:hypothetical protein